jgi:hypothetical protein
MLAPIYRHRSDSGLMTLRKGEDGRWELMFDDRGVCSYLTPEKAAHFVASGKTGDSRIDTMAARPRTLFDWQR